MFLPKHVETEFTYHVQKKDSYRIRVSVRDDQDRQLLFCPSSGEGVGHVHGMM